MYRDLEEQIKNLEKSDLYLVTWTSLDGELVGMYIKAESEKEATEQIPFYKDVKKLESPPTPDTVKFNGIKALSDLSNRNPLRGPSEI